jgi:hypothetical protein
VLPIPVDVETNVAWHNLRETLAVAQKILSNSVTHVRANPHSLPHAVTRNTRYEPTPGRQMQKTRQNTLFTENSGLATIENGRICGSIEACFD